LYPFVKCEADVNRTLKSWKKILFLSIWLGINAPIALFSFFTKWWIKLRKMMI